MSQHVFSYFQSVTTILICLILAGMLWLGALVVRADTHYVSLSGTNDSTGGYTDWAGAATQIQWAVDAAILNDTVLVSNGIYYLTNQITIANSITLKSFSGYYTNTIINGNFPDYTNRGVFLTNFGAVLDGFTITNCFSTNYPDNMFGVGLNANPYKLITNCLITGNTFSNATSHAYVAGGGHLRNGTVSHCRFIGNRVLIASSGNGGLTIRGTGMVYNCMFLGNTSASGGYALWLAYDSGQTGMNCVVAGNTGRGVNLAEGPCLFSSIVSNNTSDGITMARSFVRNCLFVQNGGCGVYISVGATDSSSINNCTIANNGSYGVYYNVWPPSSSYIANSIIYNNRNGTNWGYVGTNIVYTNCCVIPIPTNVPGQPQGTGNITNAPLFADTNSGNYRVSGNSPCVNTGTNRNWMTNTYDLDGKQRIRYGTVDRGAYERIYDGSIYTVH